MSKIYWVLGQSSHKAVEEAWKRAEGEGFIPRIDRIGIHLLGCWDIFGYKPYLITLIV